VHLNDKACGSGWCGHKNILMERRAEISLVLATDHRMIVKNLN